MKNKICIYRGGQKTLVYFSMKELEDHLHNKQFMRVHKSFIIPLFKIASIEGNMLRLKDVTAEIMIGENYKAQLMELIKQRMFQ